MLHRPDGGEPADAASPRFLCNAMSIRAAVAGDIAAIQAIYAHHVAHGLASFETTPPTRTEMAARWQAIVGAHLPYLVIEDGGAVAGFAYAGPYRTRPAYRHTLEDSIYLAPSAAGRGLGRALLARLVDECAQRGARQLIAVIGDSANAASMAVHRACGFRQIGVLEAVGWKFGRWVDSVIMQRALGAGRDTPPA
jgi:phosphinothricin acetyltransferase